MKLTTLAAAIALCLPATISNGRAHSPVSVLAIRNDLFYFKVGRVLRGAVVEVYSSSGELIFSDTLKHHRMLIDFFEKNDDDYTIRIKSKCSEVNYLYTKFDPAGIDAFKPMVKLIP
ncbi:MAG: hypothetical protein QM762_27235 [Chryseolinea sp.]